MYKLKDLKKALDIILKHDPEGTFVPEHDIIYLGDYESVSKFASKEEMLVLEDLGISDECDSCSFNC